MQMFFKYLKRRSPQMISGYQVVRDVDFRFPGLRIIHRRRVTQTMKIIIVKRMDHILAGLLVYEDSVHADSSFVHLVQKKDRVAGKDV